MGFNPKLEVQLRVYQVPVRWRLDFARPRTKFALGFSLYFPVPFKRKLENRDSKCNKAKGSLGSTIIHWRQNDYGTVNEDSCSHDLTYGDEDSTSFNSGLKGSSREGLSTTNPAINN